MAKTKAVPAARVSMPLLSPISNSRLVAGLAVLVVLPLGGIRALGPLAKALGLGAPSEIGRAHV